MSDLDSFKEYLKIYNPTAYDVVNKSDAKPEDLARVYAENAHRFEIWESIPAEIRNRYPGTRVPDDVWEAAARGEIYTLREMEYHRDIKQISEAREKAVEESNKRDSDMYKVAEETFVSALAAGYSLETCHQLVMNRLHRLSLLDEKPIDLSSEEGKEWFKKWLATREKDFATLKKELEQRHPGKALMHHLMRYNRGKLSKTEMEEFPDKVAKLVERLEASPEHMSRFLRHLKMPHMQAAIGHFNTETLGVLKHTVLRSVEEGEKEQYLAKDFAKRRDELRNLPDLDKARMVSDNITQKIANLPGERTLSAKERLINMPSALNQGRTI